MPADGGWRVTAEGIDNVLMFRRGTTAERAAIRLAESAATVGEFARIHFHLPDGTVAKRFICPVGDSVRVAPEVQWSRGKG